MFYPLHPLRAFMYKNDAPISIKSLRIISSKLHHYLSQELRIIDENKLTAIYNCLLSYPEGINLNLISFLLHFLSQHRANEYSDKAQYSLKLICDIALNFLRNIIPSHISKQQFKSDYHHKNFLYNIVTVLKSLTKLPIDLIANESLIIKCLAILEDQIHNLDRLQLSLILNSLPKLFLRPDRFNQQKSFICKLLDTTEKVYLKSDVNTIQSSATTNKLIDLERDEIITMLCALPKIGVNLQHRHSLIAFLLTQAKQKINNFNLKEISSLLIVMPKLCINIAFYATLISSLFVRAYEKIQSNLLHDPYLVSNMLFIISTFDEVNIDSLVRQNLLSVLLESAKQLVFQFNCVEITMLISSMNRLGVNPTILHDFIENLLKQVLILIRQANNNKTSMPSRQFSEFEVAQILYHLFHLKVNIHTHLELVDELLKLASNYVYTFCNVEFALLFIALRTLYRHPILKFNHNVLLTELFKRAKMITKDLGNLEIAYILNALPELMNNDFDNPFNRELIDLIFAKALEIVTIFNLREIHLILESIKRSPQFILKHNQFLDLLEQRCALLQTQSEQHIPFANPMQIDDQSSNANSIKHSLKLDSNNNGITQIGQQRFILEFKPSHNTIKRSYHVGMTKLEHSGMKANIS